MAGKKLAENLSEKKSAKKDQRKKTSEKNPSYLGAFPPGNVLLLLDESKFNLYAQPTQDFFAACREKILFQTMFQEIFRTIAKMW